MTVSIIYYLWQDWNNKKTPTIVGEIMFWRFNYINKRNGLPFYNVVVSWAFSLRVYLLSLTPIYQKSRMKHIKLINNMEQTIGSKWNYLTSIRKLTPKAPTTQGNWYLYLHGSTPGPWGSFVGNPKRWGWCARYNEARQRALAGGLEHMHQSVRPWA